MLRCNSYLKFLIGEIESYNSLKISSLWFVGYAAIDATFINKYLKKDILIGILGKYSINNLS